MTTKTELQAQIAELEATQVQADVLHQISCGLNMPCNEDELLQLLAQPAIEAGAIDASLLYIDLDENHEPDRCVKVAAWRREGIPGMLAGTSYSMRKFPFGNLVLSNPNEAQLITDGLVDERIDVKSRAILKRQGYRAVAVIPMFQAGRWVGFMVFNWREVHEFTPQEVAIYQAFVGLAAPAIASRRLLQQTETALARTEALYVGSDRVVRAITPDDILLALVESTAIQLFDRAGILIFDRVWNETPPKDVTLVAAWGRSDRPSSAPIGVCYPLDQVPFVAHVSRDEPTFVQDAAADERVNEQTRAVLDQLGTQSVALFPLIAGEQWIGLLTVQSGVPVELTEEQIRQIASLTGQAAAVVQSQYLLEQVQAAREQSETLYGVSHGLNAARNEAELLQVMAQPAREAGIVAASLYSVELDTSGESEWVELVAIWQREEGAVDGDVLSSQIGTRYYLPKFPLTHLWMTSPDEPQLIADVTIDERVDEAVRRVMVRMGRCALALIPLVYAGRRVGFVTFAWAEAHEFNEQEVQVYMALTNLVSPAMDNHRMVRNLERMIAERTAALQEREEQYRTLIETIHDWIWELDVKGVFSYASPSVRDMLGYEPEEVLGKTPLDMMPPEKVRRVGEMLGAIVDARELIRAFEMVALHKDGRPITLETNGEPFFDAEGAFLGYRGISRDITARKQAEAEREHLRQEIIDAQGRALEELSTPIIPIMDTPQGGIIVMPLIGSIDSMRATYIMRALLAGIRKHQAAVVILDVTGVPIVDSGVANHLNKTIKAARLKGARAIVTGISEAVAETIVDLGIDWTSIETVTDLRTGLVVALHSLGVEMTSRRGDVASLTERR